MTTRKFECPVCGYRFLADPEGVYSRGQVYLTRGDGEKQTPGMTPEAGSTIDLTCPNCENEFEVAFGA